MEDAGPRLQTSTERPESGATPVKFGIFYEHQLPRPWEADDERRRAGTGSALLASVMAAATAGGADHFLLTSAARDLAAATRFYAPHGLQPWYVRMCRRG
jgi:hypothetical protein